MEIKILCFVHSDKGKETPLCLLRNHIPALQFLLAPVLESFQIRGNDLLPNETLS